MACLFCGKGRCNCFAAPAPTEAEVIAQRIATHDALARIGFCAPRGYRNASDRLCAELSEASR